MINDIALQKTLEDYTEGRDKALTMIREHLDNEQRIKEYLADYGRYLCPELGSRSSYDRMRKELDRSFWRRAFELTGFRLLMDAEAKQQFDRSLENDAPEFTMDVITETFLSLHQDADAMFKRGIVNIFRRLSGNYVTNTKDPFTIGDKIIIEQMITMFHGYPRINYGREQMLTDIDRVIKVVLGEPHNPRDLESAMNAAFEAGEVYEDEFYKARAFKKGTLHLWLKKPEAVEKINGLIAEYYGEGKLAA